MCDWIPTPLSNTFPKFVIFLKSSLKIKGPIPKDCQKGDCRHLVENGLLFNRTDLNKGYGVNSKVSIHSLMKTHLLYNCERYLYSMEYKPL